MPCVLQGSCNGVTQLFDLLTQLLGIISKPACAVPLSFALPCFFTLLLPQWHNYDKFGAPLLGIKSRSIPKLAVGKDSLHRADVIYQVT